MYMHTAVKKRKASCSPLSDLIKLNALVMAAPAFVSASSFGEPSATSTTPNLKANILMTAGRK